MRQITKDLNWPNVLTYVIKGSQLDAFCPGFLPIGHSVLLRWIQTSLSWKPEIVLIRVTELSEPIVLRKQKGDEFNGSQLAKMKKSIPDMSLSWNW